MPVTKTIELFTYDELSDRAKQTARDWWLSCRDASDLEHVIEDFATICGFLGINLKERSFQTMGGQTRYEPDVSWSLGYCQSDFAAFEGTFRYAKGGLAKLKEYAPQDEKLHGIAERLQALQAGAFYSISGEVTYHHYYGLQVEAEKERGTLSPEDEGAVREIMKDLANWLYWQLRETDQAQSEEEAIADAMEANEYTFRADGTREDPED